MLTVMPVEPAEKNHDHRLTLFSVSAGMVGVCLTGVGLIGVVKSIRQMETTVDELLTVSALIFLISTALYFVTLRREDQAKWTLIDHVADAIFFLALTLLLAACVVFTIGFE
jgi:UDP-N-acetylmuramyl pentapeptide phosphotransferase/UDP-N-acetylglucosamine-1-phosphate transferase